MKKKEPYTIKQLLSTIAAAIGYYITRKYFGRYPPYNSTVQFRKTTWRKNSAGVTQGFIGENAVCRINHSHRGWLITQLVAVKEWYSHDTYFPSLGCAMHYWEVYGLSEAMGNIIEGGRW